MIPSVLATQYREGLIDYVDTTFPITSPIFDGCVRRFLERKDAFFHDPYISVRLPFRVAEHGNERFESIHSNYAPYVHQNRAFDRLTGDDPRSTLVATGTGSGKTECFLYPLLEYCYQHRGESGIKAIIIYPMNALATDQAGRIARLVHSSPELRGNITVGMYVGGQSKADSRIMQPDKVISHHDTLLLSPPDILLTNYKMLDYLLVRPHDAMLWRQNKDGQLRYVVVDELHTFDGAQGTDLACLIRRLKSRLGIKPGNLCCVGTSATMGGEESIKPMLEYAHAVFGEPFDEDAIITEDRLSSAEFFDGCEVNLYHIPTAHDTQVLTELAEKEDKDEYIRQAAACWFDEPDRILQPLSDPGRVELGRKLMHHSFFQSLMGIMDSKVCQPDMIIGEMSNVYPEMARGDGGALLDSMLALVSHARTTDAMGNLRPFLQVQIQLWMRELRRVMAKVDAKQSELMLESDLNRVKADRHEHYLPVVNCRDCGATGWVGMIDSRSQIGVKDMKAFYNRYFDHDKRVRMIFPRREGDGNPEVHNKYRFCPQCLYVQPEQSGSNKCGACGHATIPVWMPQLSVSGISNDYKCPFCGGIHSIVLIGVRSATGISAGISQIYASRFNDDKKLLAFNDNVQDASHRAGFFNARTWRFGLRTAMQHFVCDGGEGMSLDRFGDALNDYWLNKLGEKAYIDTFIPYKMAGDRSYEALQKTGEFPDEGGRKGLLCDVKNRIAYETKLEYGISSHVGRTLEKSAASMIEVADAVVDSITDPALQRIQNEAGVRDISKEQLRSFILLWIDHMRQNGAFELPEYNVYVRAGASGAALNNVYKWMAVNYSDPIFPSNSLKGGFEQLGANCWYARKFSQLIGKSPLECPGIPHAVSILFDEMEKAELLKRMEAPNHSAAFGLNPALFTVTRSIDKCKCSVCGRIISVPHSQSAAWENAPCSRASCMGHYVHIDYTPDYYAGLYRDGDLVRIHACEHTGLLNRDDRETLEIKFKHKPQEHKPWDPNLLSCTPTLEMGIDIGDLSTVVLCSIPPAQSKYLQRIGRAGRTDGNALMISVASAKPHDLYFYQEPLEMISGKVDPPGVFLNASAVLERQFVAFCFDNWVKSKEAEQMIPTKVKSILGKINQQNEPVDSFPFNFLMYIKANLSELDRKFEALFEKDELTEDSRKRIRDFATGMGDDRESLRYKILYAFKELYAQRESLRKDIRKLKKAIDTLSQKPKDASFDKEMKELNMERMGLIKVVAEMEEKNTFNFLSDEGLLPNYAFPEAGVILKAIMTRRAAKKANTPDEQNDGLERYTYEFNRSASAAISEFAPENNFYAGGHKLRIDQVDVATTEPEQWRLCPNCDHAAPVSTLHNVAACPRCGSVSWGDQGQIRTMLKVRTVYSNCEYEDSRAGDESDDRTTRLYSKEMLVDIDEEHDVTCGYQTTTGDLPFGYEFVSKATLREINFGESSTVGTRLAVAGREEIRNGFRICKYCGKIQPRNPKAPPVHTKICRVVTQNLKEPYEDCMFLYREFTSEAIRILIPSTSMDTSGMKTESFAAAIMLGLKKMFKNVDHLNYCLMDAPVPGAECRKQYMVIFDSVPGGTGYLKELMAEPDKMMRVFELALDAMESCSCAADQDKDGCYHCLFAYRQSTKINNISRRCAIDLIRKILSGKDSLEKIKGVSSIAINTLIDSELEKRFIEAIAQYSSPQCTVEITKVPVNGKEGYFLQIGPCSWELELQAYFDGVRGVKVPSRSDFVFWPKTSGSKQRPVVVFADGFQFHKDKVAMDSNKRLAIRDACDYPVWSLTWNDVQRQLSPNPAPVRNNALDMDSMPCREYARQTLKKKDLPEMNMTYMTSFDMLMRYLSDPDADAVFEANANALAIALIDKANSGQKGAFDAWKASFEILPTLNSTVKMPEHKKVLFGQKTVSDNLTILMELPTTAVGSKKTPSGKTVPDFNAEQVKLVVRLNDKSDDSDSAFAESWSQFLYVTNALQFAATNLFVTEKGCEDELYQWYAFSHAQTLALPASAATKNDLEWARLFKDDLAEEFTTPEILSLAHKLKDAQIVPPDVVGYEVEDLGIAELVWKSKKIAVILPAQAQCREALIALGWRVFMFDDENLPDALKEG